MLLNLWVPTPVGTQRTLSQESHQMPAYQIFTSWFITVAKSQLWSSNKVSVSILCSVTSGSQLSLSSQCSPAHPSLPFSSGYTEAPGVPTPPGASSHCKTGHRKVWNVPRVCLSSLCRGHASLLCIIRILECALAEQAYCEILLCRGHHNMRSCSKGGTEQGG